MISSSYLGCASYKAENGQPGDINFLNGLYGQDCIIEVPLGTIIKDNKTNVIIHEIKNIHDKIIIANGGNGGIGNGANKNRNKNEKSVCISPERGEKKILKLELNLIADIGLIGVPNAGKSTLLDRITNAKPKIASYPFTTIVPNLGICNILNNNISYNQIMTVCDIPGLIENAHLGVGLGINFLKHIERCKMIIHVINGDSIDPVNDYITINNELKLFSINLANKPQVVVLNKIDLQNVKNKQHHILMKLKQSMSHSRLVSISADKNIGVQDLIEKTWNFLNKIKYDEIQQKQQEQQQQQQQLTTDSFFVRIGNNIDSRSSGSSSNSIMNHNYDYHGTNHKYDDNMIIDIQAIKSSLQIFYLTNNKVLITGNAVINAMIDELYNIDSYYGSLDRFESLVDSIDLSNEIYKVITTNNNVNNDYDDDKNHKNIRNNRSRMVSNARYSYNLANRVDDVEVIDKKVDNQLSTKIFNDTDDYKNDDIIVVFKTSTDQEVTMKLKNHKFTIP